MYTTPNSIAVGPIAVDPIAGFDPQSGHYLVDFAEVFNLINSGTLASVRQGDYLFIDTSFPDTHGYMVVGFGASLPCHYVKSEQSTMSLQGSRVNIRLPYGLPPYALFDRVPYVADWSGRSPRDIVPFYCSRSYFTHGTWTFITVPDRWIVNEESIYRSNFHVTFSGNIVVSGD